MEFDFGSRCVLPEEPISSYSATRAVVVASPKSVLRTAKSSCSTAREGALAPLADARLC